MNKALECVELTKYYGRTPVLDKLSLELAPGRVLGLLGPNGAGKSTLIKLMTGLLWPSSGRVLIDGCDVHGDHARALAQVGAVIEYPNFLPDLSGRRNLEILSGGHGEKYRDRLAEITELVNIDYALDGKVRTFSTGMKQRLGIALALLPDSRFVILDEPTNGLDPAGIVEIRRIIREFNARYGTTVIVSSHLLGEIEQICDEVAILQHGRLIAHGELAKLLRRTAELEIRLDRPAEALAWLKTPDLECAGLIEKARLDAEGTLLVTPRGEPDELAVKLNRLLVARNFAVREFGRRHYSLEDYFLSELGLDGKGDSSCGE